MIPNRIPIRPEAEARTQLRPYLDDLIASIRHGFAEWERLGSLDRSLRSPLGPRERANFIYAHIVQEARRRLGDREGIVLTDQGGFLKVHIGREFILRFKKLDARGLSRNVQTMQQQLFSQQMQMFGLGDETRITAGYQINELATAIADIKVVCPEGRRNAWAFSAIDERGGESSLPDSIPTMPIAPASETKVEAKPEKIRRDERAAGDNA